MVIPFTAVGLAALVLAAGPALAECKDDIAAIEDQVVAAETGAAPDESGMAATKHQSEVLTGEQETMQSAGTAESSTAPATRHQEETLAGEETTASQEASPEIGQLLQEARDHAAAGDEEACAQKLEEVRSQMGG